MKMVEAAQAALKELGRAASVREIHRKIESDGLFKFGAKDPVGVLGGTMRRRTAGSRSLRGEALFRSKDRGQYEVI